MLQDPRLTDSEIIDIELCIRKYIVPTSSYSFYILLYDVIKTNAKK